jgi:ubiquitin conjugation factor E4 B
LSDPNDPFNRAPLKIEDVIPGTVRIDNILSANHVLITIVDTELKQKIEAFKAERKAAKMQALKGDSMDTSTG